MSALVHADSPADEPKSEITVVAPLEASPAESGDVADPIQTGDVELTPPTNSTLRIAKRPWLLKKLVGSKSEPSQKMNPPIPPAELLDPPSMSQIVPQQRSEAKPPTQQRHQEAKTQPEQAARSKTQVFRPSHASESSNNSTTKPLSKPLSPAPQPLRDPVPRKTPAQVQDLAAPNQSVKAPVVSTPPSEGPGKVIAGEVQPPDFDADQPDSDQTEVSVRELIIRPDGTPASEQEPGQSESTKQAPSEVAVQQEATKEEADSQYVGDIDDPASNSTESEVPESEVTESEVTESEPQLAPSPPLDYVGYPKQQIRLTRNVVRMKGMMQQCLRYYYQRPEIANQRSNWGMMHSIMVYGIDTKVIVGRKRYSAIAWVAGNNACRGQKLLTEENGTIAAKNGVGLQGHQAQMLAVLSLAGVPSTYTLYARDTAYKVDDLIESEKHACKKGEELTFTLIGLAHYLDTESEWQNADGETWDFEKLIREELSQPIVGAACGGSHRLMGFGHALRARRAEGLPITGQWKRAEQYVKKFVQYTYRLQNRDGSMSTDWFEGREDNGDLDRKVQTTGHMVEWLLTVTPDSQLQNPRLVSAIRFLLNSMYQERGNEWKIGPKGHALRSLAMYYERVYQSGPAWRTPAIAGRRTSRQR